MTTAGRPVGIAEMAKAIGGGEHRLEALAARQVDDHRDRRAPAPAMTRIWLVSLSSWRVSGVFVVVLGLQHPGDVPDLGRHAGRGDDELAGAAGDVGVHVDHVGAVAERRVGAARRPRRPSTTGRLSPVSADSATSSVAACEQAAVGGHDVAGLDRDDVAGHELARAGSSTSAPSRRTFALMIIIFCSAATAAAALPSWCRPSTALNSVSSEQHDAGAVLLERDRCCRCRRPAARSASGRCTGAGTRASGAPARPRRSGWGRTASSRDGGLGGRQALLGVDAERRRDVGAGGVVPGRPAGVVGATAVTSAIESSSSLSRGHSPAVSAAGDGVRDR